MPAKDRSLLFCFVAAVHLCALTSPLAAQPTPDWLVHQFDRAGDNRAELVDAVARVPDDHREPLLFLIRWMPQRDLVALKADDLLENVALAMLAREEAGWKIPDALFFNDVLPYAVVSEPRDAWRKDFRARFTDQVKACPTTGAAALKLNRLVFDELGVHYHTGRKRADQSPRESIAQGRATCTGLSIILINACRAVGIPARFTGVHSWSDDRGNHSWVEIWDTEDEAWHFLGADEPDERGLDHGWFVADAARAKKGSRAHAVWSTSWKRTAHTFPLSFAPQITDVYAVDVTDRYAAKKSESGRLCRLYVKVTDGSGKRLVRNVALYDPSSAESQQAKLQAPVAVGKTRGERADLNDLLTFEVARGKRVRLRAWLDGGVRSQEVEVPDQESHLVHLTADRSITADEAAGVWFDATPDDRPLIPQDSLEQLVHADEQAARELVWQAYARPERHQQLAADFAENRVSSGEVTSPYTVKQVGQRPTEGWPLVIAMHGGGGTTQEFNDSQWARMQVYYKDHPDAGGYKYVALRAPNNEWNGFYADYVYPLMDQLISNFALFGDIDRDRVYLIGYSHGGYGAFAIGPKMPDRFAAIHSSAAAPTDGETTAKTLRTTRFTHMVGEHDEAHGRAERNQRFADQIKRLRGGRTDIYPVEMLWMEGYGHSGLPDRDYLTKMLPHVRNPAPPEIYWRQTDSVIDRLFWLADEQPKKGRELLALCDDNRVTLESDTVDRITLLLDSRLVDFQRPIEIVRPSGEVERVDLEPSAHTLLATMERYVDKARAPTCQFIVDLR